MPWRWTWFLSKMHKEETLGELAIAGLKTNNVITWQRELLLSLTLEGCSGVFSLYK